LTGTDLAVMFNDASAAFPAIDDIPQTIDRPASRATLV
jgi:hypothetical protein